MGHLLATFLVVATVQPLATPREVVQTAVARAVAVVQQSRGEAGARARAPRALSDQARAEIRRIAGGLFDFDEMARRSLSRHWATLSREEQVEFVQLFTELLERTYLGRIQSYAGEQLTYLGEEIDGPFATVKSRVVTTRRTETALEYRLRLKDGQWKVYDLLVDGVSFVSTYRSEFSRVIQSSSYAVLLQRMREKTLVTPVTSLPRSGG